MPAMPATGQASPQAGFGPQNGPQDEIVLQHESAYFALAVPARAELEMLLDFYGQKPRVSLMILICIGMPPSYQIDTPVSRGRAGALLLRKASHTEFPDRPSENYRLLGNKKPL